MGGCDSLFGPGGPAPAAIEIAPFPDALAAGQTVALAATVRDGFGEPIAGAAVRWGAAHGSVAPATSATGEDGVAAAAWTLGTAAGPQTLNARAGRAEAVVTAQVGPGPAVSIAISPAELAFDALGDTAVLSTAATDAWGNPVPAAALAWTSRDADVATVAASAVVAAGQGSAWVVASGGGASDSARVTVTQVATAVGLTPGDVVFVRDETVVLAASLVDARGHPLPGGVAPDWWSSSDPAVATVDDAGTVTAIAPGTARITAGHGALEGGADLDVRDGPRPAISAIVPAVLSPGDTATLSGSGFATAVTSNRVLVDGREAVVVAAAAGEIRAVIPAHDRPCGPTAPARVDVAVDRLEGAPFEHPMAAARLVTLEPGASRSFLTAPAAACLELSEPGRYLVTVFNAATSSASMPGFRLRGSGPAAAPAAAARHEPARAVTTTRPAAEPGHGAHHGAHHGALEASRRLAEELLARAADRATPPLARSVARIEQGDTRVFRVPDMDTPGQLCTNHGTVTARAAYVGETGVIWEDVAAPLAGTMDTAWARLGAEVDEVMVPIVRDHFADPLVHGGGGGGRLAMLFTPRINQLEAELGGFVYTGDFFPRDTCPSSNEGETFYAGVPTLEGAGHVTDGRDRTVPAFLRDMRALVIHEIKHIAAFGWKIAHAQGGVANFEETWLEEATARLAEELYARALFGHERAGRVGYQQSIGCERDLSDASPGCASMPIVMQRHFAGLGGYLRDPGGLTPIGSAAPGTDFTFYGSGWLLLRWAIDHSALDEDVFTRAIVQDPTRSGAANLVARADTGFAALLADFHLAIATDGHPTTTAPPANPRLTHPGWDLRDIYAGLHQDAGDAYPAPWPLQTRTPAPGDFTANVPGVRGGSAVLFDLDGVTGAQILELLGGGGPAPATLGLAVVRLQ